MIGIPITTFADVFLSSAQPPPTLTLGTAHSPDVVSPDTLSQVVLLPRTTTVASLYGQLASSVVITTDAPVVMQASIYANAPTSPGTFSLQGTYGFDPLPSPIAVGSTVSLAISSLSLGPYPAGTSLLALLTVQPSGSLSFTGGAFYLSMSYGMV